jgi:SAM-dependent methyltransferase
VDSVNLAWYSRPAAVGSFAGDDYLEPALVLLLLRYKDRIVGRDVLDLGVGAGRTTLYLSALTPRYVGIDYSPPMVAHSARRFPNVRIELDDARDLSRFQPSSFDFVLFSYAGIGAMDHDGRLQVLRAVARVLRPGGVFAFSAHNRDYRDAREGPRLQRSRNPVTQLANVVRWARQAGNHRRMQRLEQETPEYALINDVAENYSLLHYYVSADAQREQLRGAGLSVDLVSDGLGGEVQPGALVKDSPWLWYAARKPGG